MLYRMPAGWQPPTVQRGVDRLEHGDLGRNFRKAGPMQSPLPRLDFEQLCGNTLLLGSRA
jgi:hypothetical protein